MSFNQVSPYKFLAFEGWSGLGVELAMGQNYLFSAIYKDFTGVWVNYLDACHVVL